MSDITTANVVYVSSSKNGDYVEATPHDGAVRYIRADAPELVALIDAASAMADAAEHGDMTSVEVVNYDAALAKWEALQ